MSRNFEVSEMKKEWMPGGHDIVKFRTFVVASEGDIARRLRALGAEVHVAKIEPSGFATRLWVDRPVAYVGCRPEADLSQDVWTAFIEPTWEAVDAFMQANGRSSVK